MAGDSPPPPPPAIEINMPLSEGHQSGSTSNASDLGVYLRNAFFSFKQRAIDPHQGTLGRNPAFVAATSQIGTLKQNIRPWTEFFDTKKFSMKNAMAGPLASSRRVSRNLEYFLSNYAVIFAVLLVYSLLTSPLILLTLLSSLALQYYVGNNKSRLFLIKNYPLTNMQIYSLVGLLYTMPLLYLFGAGAFIFSLLGLNCFIVGVHAITYDGIPEVDIKNHPELLFEQTI